MMTIRPCRVLAVVAGVWVAAAPAAFAVEIAPHRALYSLTLGSSKSSSGVVGASGAMVYEWGETCDGWTVQQRFRLRLQYAEQDGVDVSSNLVTWESKDGLRYRFNERRLRNGEPDEEIKGEAKLDDAGKGGTAEFSRPEATTLTLAPGVLFPTAHTILLIDRAQAGEQFVSKQVFDGATVENASQITAGGRRSRRRQIRRQRALEAPVLARAARLLPRRQQVGAARLRTGHEAARQRRVAGHVARLQRLHHPRQA